MSSYGLETTKSCSSSLSQNIENEDNEIKLESPSNDLAGGVDPLSAILPDDPRVTNPQEEDLFGRLEDGLGYFPDAAPDRYLKHYRLARKVCLLVALIYYV